MDCRRKKLEECRVRMWWLLGLFFGGIVFAQPATVRVAAASDLQPVLPQIIKQYEQKTGRQVLVSYGASATLATQILSGAPFDLFLSADVGFAQKIANAGLSDPPLPYAQGTLVLWARNDSVLQPLDLGSLRNPKLRRLAVADPQHAPYGRAAQAAIARMGLTGELRTKLVIGENIAQTAQFAQSGNADAGLISLTSALSPLFRQSGTYVVVPQQDYPPIVQAAVVLKRSPGAGYGQALLEFLLSPSAQAAFAQGGLQPVQ